MYMPYSVFRWFGTATADDSLHVLMGLCNMLTGWDSRHESQTHPALPWSVAVLLANYGSVYHPQYHCMIKGEDSTSLASRERLPKYSFCCAMWVCCMLNTETPWQHISNTECTRTGRKVKGLSCPPVCTERGIYNVYSLVRYIYLP